MSAPLAGSPVVTSTHRARAVEALDRAGFTRTLDQEQVIAEAIAAAYVAGVDAGTLDTIERRRRQQATTNPQRGLRFEHRRWKQHVPGVRVADSPPEVCRVTRTLRGTVYYRTDDGTGNSYRIERDAFGEIVGRVLTDDDLAGQMPLTSDDVAVVLAGPTSDA